MTDLKLYELRTPTMAPFGVPITKDGVQEVWDVFVKPMQRDDAPPQSVEDRALMAILRAVYGAMERGEVQTPQLDPEKVAEVVERSAAEWGDSARVRDVLAQYISRALCEAYTEGKLT